MTSESLDFTVNLGGVDARALLANTVWRVDALEGYLSDEAHTAQPGPAGLLVRSMHEDVAEFAAFPVVYPITAQHFVARDGVQAEGFRQLSKRSRFYRIEFPVNLFPRSSWSFDRLEVRVEFNPGDAGPTRPKAFQVFPNRQLETLAGWKYELRVHLDSNLKFTVEVPVAIARADAGASGTVSTGLDVTIGPFEYRLKRVAVEASAPGIEKAFWRLDGANLFQQDSPRFIVITQVPFATTTVNVVCALQAYRNYAFLADRVRNTFRELPKAIRTFFQNGAPLHAEASYHISMDCVG